MTLAEGLVRKAKGLFGQFARYCRRMQRRVEREIDRDSDAELFIRLEEVLKSDPGEWLEPYAMVLSLPEYFRRRRKEQEAHEFVRDYMESYIKSEYYTLATAIGMMLDEEKKAAFNAIRAYRGRDAKRMALAALAKAKGLFDDANNGLVEEVFRRMGVNEGEYCRVIDRLRMLIGFTEDRR